MIKKLTKSEIEQMQSYSIKGEQYVRLEDVQAALEARADEEKADARPDVARQGSAGGDRGKSN